MEESLRFQAPLWLDGKHACAEHLPRSLSQMQSLGANHSLVLLVEDHLATFGLVSIADRRRTNDISKMESNA